METKKKTWLIVLLLLLSVFLTPTAVCSVSAESSKTAETQASKPEMYYETSEVNPIYKDEISEDDLITMEESQTNQRLDASSDEIYTTIEDAGAEVRRQMKNRINTVVINYKMPIEEYKENGLPLTQIFNKAFEYTGDPTEGDYLLYQYGGMQGGASIKGSGNNYIFTITYTVAYYTTAEQEEELDTQLKEVMDELDLEGCSNYKKVQKIYDYICANVTYDYDHLNDSSYTLMRTAYGALMDHTVVCQGYTVLLYRMLLEAGIDNRIVSGTGNGGSHAWNIVKLGDFYYDLDATWDAPRYAIGHDYDYFLKSDVDFTDHSRGTYTTIIDYTSEDFNQQYPMSTVSYDTENDPECINSHTWSSEYTVDKEATCGEVGSQSVHCTKCGTKETQEIPATGKHQYGDWTVAVAATCGKAGSKERTCSVCGETEKEEISATGEHQYGDWTVAAATCTEAGSKERTCSVCGEIEKEEVKATGHSWEAEYTIDTSATCTEAGSQSIHCEKCDAVKDSVAIPAKGHSYAYEDNSDNSHTATCSNCNLTVTQAHTYINGVCRACNAVVTTTYKVKWYMDGTESGTKTVKKGNICSVKAAEVDGKTFSHWSSKADGSNKLSTSKTYTFYVSKNIEVYAIYTTEAVKAEPIVSLSNTYAFTSGTKNYVRFEATRSIPAGYEVVEHGVIYGNSTTVFGKGDEDNLMRFTDEDHTTLPNKVKKLVVSGTARNGMDYLNVSVGNSKDVVVYARGYMIVRNTDTQEITVLYSDVSSGSFNNLK